MPALTHGELFMVVFIVVLVVSAPWWPRVGGAIFVRLAGGGSRETDSKRTDERGRV
jgi:hypothetical protein